MELWDIYDQDGNKTGRTAPRMTYGKRLPEGEYHIAVTVVTVNSRGEMFCTHRSPEKDAFPGMWENTGGSVLAGEDSLFAAIRELREETGLSVSPEELSFLYRVKRTDSFMDVYGLHRDFPIDEVVFQPGETDDARWFPYDEWERLARSGAILTPAGTNNEEFFSILQEYIKGVSAMPIKVGMVSLGCAKNQVDGEMLMASLKREGFQLVDDAALADIAIVNTCGFIESAKKESIEEILELAQLKKEGKIKKLVATGCLAERYQEEMRRELPELDGVLGIGANGDIAGCLKKIAAGEFVEAFPPKGKMPLCGDRELSTPSWSAYLKIAEGCDNRCAYCAIPLIRGNYRSRTMESVEEEARRLVENGAKEIVLIAQDTTRYGKDLYGQYSLAELLRRLCQIEGLHWLRVLYTYPDAITDELLDVMASEEKVVKYIDIPLQHASEPILKAMRRTGDRASLTALLQKIRARVPGVILRTTLIAGFPGETEEDFTELAEFVKEIKFDRLGCFAYSQEEGTPAADLPGQVEEEVKERRAQLIMELQGRIMEEKGLSYIGKTLEVLVEGFDRYAECWFGRSAMDAPDVDGKIFFTASGKKPRPGRFCKVRIDDCVDCDLTGVFVE